MITIYEIQKEIIENKSTSLHLNHSYKNLTIDNTTSILLKKNLFLSYLSTCRNDGNAREEHDQIEGEIWI